jgi:hypothetical protein
MNEKYMEGANFISKDDLLEHVSLSLLRNSTAGIPAIMDWVKGGVKKEPLVIFDINGTPLFYDYTIKKGVDTLGTVRASASRILGSPVIAYEIGPRYWDFESADRKLIPKVKKEYQRLKILSTKLVCYSYPKLGVMFEMADEQGMQKRLIFDIADYSLIPEKPPKPGIEGAYAWSFYDSLPEDVRKLRLKRYDQSDKWRREMPEKIRKDLKISRTLTPFINIKDLICKIKINVTKQLQFCTHYNYNESRSHHCFVLHAQQVNDYCAVATCQMILCYYRYYYAQNDIAPALSYSSGSGCPPDQSAGYEQLSCNHLDATYDTSPTWEKARDQIDALHPLKSGISGHARACAGYSYVWWLCDGVKDKKLYIYDPWPWNADYKLGGAVYWEDWDSITHTNYVFTKLLCP